MAKKESSKLASVIAKNIESIRLKRGLTQVELAQKAKISQPALHKIEAGKSSPSIETLEKIANALKVSVSELIK
jgi:transcriptional regulator with XRE-family HTH domain